MTTEHTEREVFFPPHQPTAGVFINHRAAEHPDTPLVVLGDRRVTYEEVNIQSRALARGLLANGAGKGTRVGLLAPNGPDWIIGWLAATRIGALVTLINTYQKPRELDRTLRHADVQVLLTVGQHLGHDYLERLETVVPALTTHSNGPLLTPSHPFLREIWVWGDTNRAWAKSIDQLADDGRAIDDELLTAVEAEVTPADPMVIVYSSGSTADPKGVIHSHGAVIRHAHNLSQFRDMRAGDVIYTPMPLFWIGGLSYMLVATMHAGATLVFDEQFEPGATLDLIERERCTQVIGWVHMGKALAEHPSFDDRDLSSIRGGTIEALLPENRRRIDPTRRPNALGMTESLGPHTLELEGTELPEDKLGSFGRPVPGVEHRIVDPVTGEDLEDGVLGEVQVRGYSVMQGLYKREREDTFTTDGWYSTGDGGWFDEDGHLFFKGRLGDQIKSSGMNITPREVEMVLEEDGAVLHAFVVGINHAERGQDVAAAVVLRPGAHAEAEELRATVKSELSSYKTPRHVMLFADQQDLPWLESGKIDRRAVQRLLAEHAPD